MTKVDIKVVLLGKEYSGKTSLVERFVYDQFIGENKYMNTIGAAFGAKKIEVAGQVLVLGLWFVHSMDVHSGTCSDKGVEMIVSEDTAGSERYESISRIYYRNSHSAVVCYDVTDAHSFERAKHWISELLSYEQNCKVYLCGTKKDLIKNGGKPRAVDYHSVTDYADEIMAASVFETSSKTGEGVYELFYKIAENFAKEKVVGDSANGFGVFSMEMEKKKKGCCG